MWKVAQEKLVPYLETWAPYKALWRKKQTCAKPQNRKGYLMIKECECLRVPWHWALWRPGDSFRLPMAAPLMACLRSRALVSWVFLVTLPPLACLCSPVHIVDQDHSSPFKWYILQDCCAFCPNKQTSGGDFAPVTVAQGQCYLMHTWFSVLMPPLGMGVVRKRGKRYPKS